MIPTIEDILKGVHSGAISMTEAVVLIEQHTQTAREQAVKYSDPFSIDEIELAKRDRDHFRDSMLRGVLQSIPPGAQSDMVAIFAWDVASRLVALRDMEIGVLTPEIMKHLKRVDPTVWGKMPEEAPETPEQKIKRLEKELAERNAPPMVMPDTPRQFPKNGTPPTDEGVVGLQQATWGNGAKYGDASAQAAWVGQVNQQTDEAAPIPPREAQTDVPGTHDDGPF